MDSENQATTQRVPGKAAGQILARLRDEGDTSGKARLGRNDWDSVGQLIALFGRQDEIPLSEVLNSLWPDSSEEAAVSTFRSFKKRLNARLKAWNPRYELVHPTDNRPVSAKRVWLEEKLSEDELKRRRDEEGAEQLARRIEREQRREYPDTPLHEFVSPQVTTDLPVVTFPDILRRFAEGVAPEQWRALSRDNQALLSNLGAKLEPIVQLHPPIPGSAPPVVGFECLALGPTGQSYGQIVRALPELDRGLLGCLLALSAAKTAEALRSDAAQDGVRGARHLFFTVNLDPDMLASPFFGELLDRYWEPLQHNVLFEVNEKTAGDAVALAKRHQAALNLRFALDDLEELEDDAREQLSPRAEMTKISHVKFRELMDQMGNDPDGVLRVLSSYTLPGKPLIVEGIQERLDSRFLENHWAQTGLGPLYGQGYSLVPNAPWDAWLADLRSFGLPGGQILASPFLAEATRVIVEFLTPEERKELKREWRGNVYRLEVPGRTVGQAQPLIIAIVSDRVDPRTILVADVVDADYVIVKERSSALSRVQLTPDALRGHLQARRQIPHMGREALEHAPLQDQYPLNGHVEQSVKEPRKPRGGEIVETDTESPDVQAVAADGCQFLMDWLTTKSTPFCALLGDYGMGKTFLCRVFTDAVLTEREQNPDLPVPLYLDMRGLPTWKGDRLPSLEDMVAALCEAAGFPDVSPAAVLTAVHLGRVALIFDGFDEKAAHLTDGQATELMNQIRRAAPPDSRGKVLVACRTHYFESRPHEREKVGGGSYTRTREGHVAADFRIVYLQPFDTPRIHQYLERLFGENADGVMDFLSRVHDLMDLSQRPYLLFLITQHLSELEELAKRGERIGAAHVYQSVVEEWMRRDTGKHTIPTPVKVAFMEELARRLWAEGRKHMALRQLRGWLQDRLKETLPAVRLDELDRLDADLRTATFLSRDAKGKYRFAHTSFHEFFLARHMADCLSQEHADALALPRLSKEVLEFTVDLLHSPEFDTQRARLAIETLLETSYAPRAGENALLLWRTWQRLRTKTAPSPAHFRLEGAHLEGMDLAGVVLESLDASAADLSDANLTASRLRGSLRGALLARTLARDADWEDCDLSEARLTGADLAGTRLARANLSHAQAVSTFMQRADLTSAKLDSARLSLVRLASAHVSDEQLHRAVLDRCSFLRDGLAPGRLAPLDFAADVLPGHSGGVSSVAVSPDGSWALSGSDDHTVKVWEVATGRCLRTLSGHSGWVSSVAVSPDGSRALSGSYDQTVKVWEVATGRCLRTLSGHSGEVLSVAVSPDGAWALSGSEDHTVKVWDAATGRCVRTLSGHGDAVTSVAVSPDGASALSGSDDGTVKAWELATGRCVRTLSGHGGGVWSVAATPDGAWALSASEDRTVKIWELGTGHCLRTLSGHGGEVESVGVAPHGACALSGSDDHTVKVWDLGTGRCVRTLSGHGGGVWSVAVSPDGACASSGGSDNNVRVWSLATGRCVRTISGHRSWVKSVGMSPDGAYALSGSEDRTVKVWELATGRCVRTLSGHGDVVWTVAVSPDGVSALSGGCDCAVRVWDLRAGGCVRTLSGHGGWVKSVVVSPDGAWALSGSEDQTVKVWELDTGRHVRTLSGHGGGVLSVAVSLDGAWALSGSKDGTLRVWELRTGRCLRTLSGHSGRVSSVAVSPDGSWALSGSYDHTVKVWEVATGRCLRTLSGHSGVVSSVAVSPDGRTYLSGASDGSIILWSAETGERLATLWADGEDWLALAPDGRHDGTPRGLAQLGFVHNQCVYPADEFPWLRQPLSLGSVLKGARRDK